MKAWSISTTIRNPERIPDFMKAVEANDEVKKAKIIAAKQALRDVTLTQLPDDLAGIKATWPDILNWN